MIIDTNDDRRIEVVYTLDNRLFIAIDGVHGTQETIILDVEQAIQLQSYLTESIGEMRCVHPKA